MDVPTARRRVKIGEHALRRAEERLKLAEDAEAACRARVDALRRAKEQPVPPQADDADMVAAAQQLGLDPALFRRPFEKESFRAWHTLDRTKGGVTIDELRRDCIQLAMVSAQCEKKQTFWQPGNAKPRCTLERFALAVMRFHAKAAPCLGAEFWVQVREPISDDNGAPVPEGSSIGFHWDTDEVLQERSGLSLKPRISTVTYLTDCGAPTVIFDSRDDAFGRPRAQPEDDASPCPSPARAWVSYPRTWKHIAFDGALLHGCPAEMAAPPHGIRISLLVNVWFQHQPLEITRLDTQLVRRLTNRPCFSGDKGLDRQRATVVQVRRPRRRGAAASTDGELETIQQHRDGLTAPMPMRRLCEEERQRKAGSSGAAVAGENNGGSSAGKSSSSAKKKRKKKKKGKAKKSKGGSGGGGRRRGGESLELVYSFG